MDYPIPAAIAAHLLSGLRDANVRVADIETRIAAEIAKLPAARRGSLTTDAIFANAALTLPSSSDLRTMTKNPAFKNEPSISQLRRAEAAFIEAHDAYIKEPSDRHVEEMRWAHERLRIARQFFDGIAAALPIAKRVPAHPVAAASKAVKSLRLVSFNDEEQKALRLAVVDRPAAIAQIDRIIAEGRASSNDLRMIHAYLVDPAADEMITRWLVDEQAAAARSAALVAGNVVTPSPAVPETVSMQSARLDPGFDPAPPDRTSDDPVVGEAIALIADWLDNYPAMIGKFVQDRGLWQFDDVFKAPRYRAAYGLVAESAAFQRMIEDRKSGRHVASAAA